MEHTREEMQEALEKMAAVAKDFYGPATMTGCHAFIEFCGFMNEYIQVCRNSMNEGMDFMGSNTHNEKPLKMELYHAEYLAEKFDCIFGPSLRGDPRLKEVFLSKLFPSEETG